ncbi:MULTISPECIES: hypothetical protein [unclassified Pedobacter]|uniref:hypothetical protein n=1 Tax=unclassified Pedobacter TaxID=2628915 RepID=UPI00141F4EAD|nr:MULTISPECIES: hypothetical protein [unclassified Pedobacter]NII81747.1 hypothetical protein [Pedobacter sp. SG908]NMN35750.1 hypothetical protein [Pedobacter sp. SG918]
MSDYKDVFDMVTDVRKLINIPAIVTLLGAGAKVEPSIKSTEPSVKGIVVNGISISNTSDQIGFGNVNCYAPAIISTANGKAVSLPDQATLSNLAKAVKPLIDGVFKPTFRVWVESLPTIIQDTDGSYFANMTFRYQSIQNNYNNI